VFDVAGRHVRTVPEAEWGPGRGTVLWDGRDESGRLVPSGIYIARVAFGLGAKSMRLMRIR
jgi:hypothetical protein